jgi:hypothetical protein
MNASNASKSIVTVLVFLVVVALIQPVMAEKQKGGSGNLITSVPRTMSYQGILEDSGGDPVTDSVYSVTFRIFDAESGGTSEWQEILPCTTSAGYFTAVFSNVNIPFDEDYWLELEVGGEILDPRQKMNMVAYAAVSDTADYAFVVPAGAGSNWSVTDSVLYTNDPLGIARGGADNLISPGAGNSGHINFGVACTTGNQSYFRRYCTISGGYSNTARAHYSTVGGGANNKITSGDYSIIGGGEENTVDAGRSAICGGEFNLIADHFGTIGGGSGNLAGSDDGDPMNDRFATVAGGRSNSASGFESTVAGGQDNTANGNEATIGGGSENNASGNDATVPGGYSNLASGDYSMVVSGRYGAALQRDAFAAGSRAKANHYGAAVISASFYNGSADSVSSGGDEQMVLRADGGIYITNTSELAPYDNTNIITTRGGAYLSGNGTNWINSSDRNKKENFTPVDGRALLQKLESLEITEWNHKDEGKSVRHIGPVAQDFYAVFGLGNDDKSISTVDPSGVALAGIKELIQENRELRGLILKLEKRVDELESR